MEVQTPISSAQFRCFGAWLFWIVAIYAAWVIAARFEIISDLSIPSVADGNLLPKEMSKLAGADGFLVSVLKRATGDLYYGLMLCAFAGTLIYAGALTAISARGAQSPQLFIALVGISNAGRIVLEPPHSGYAIASAPVRNAITLFPALGFLGTVIGVSVAIGGLQDVLDGQEPTALLAGLRTAFDTTFLGLLASLILTLLSMLNDQLRAVHTMRLTNSIS